MAKDIQIEQEYGRFIPPVVEKAIDKAEDDALLDNETVTETDDGGAIITTPEEAPEESSFYDNLAETMDSRELRDIATDLLELVEKDKKAREKRDEQYEEGIRRTGLGKDAPGGATFEGASRVVHPVMAEACVDFASRAIKELFPPSGPVRTKIIGKSTRVKLEQADKKREFVNWQLTNQIRNYRSELEQLLTQLPLGGGQYLKFWYDEQAKRPDCEFVPIDQVYLPFSCSNFYNSPRVTHVQDITRYEFEKRVRTGLYREIDLLDPSIEPDPTKASTASDKVEGKEATAYNEDGTRRVFEIAVFFSIKKDDIAKGDVAPYLITVDESSSTVLSIYRNWAEGDAKFEKLDWMVQFPFIPWRGAYPIGLPQLIGGLSAALTGALRALLDTAHVNNAATLIKLKGATGARSLSGANKSVDITEVTEIDGPVGTDDIRKIIMPMPFNPPSAVLFQLLDWLTNQAKGVVATAEEKIADANNNMPVGTALALIEQGSITYSAIHSRLHHAQAKALEIICRINRTFLDEEQVIEDLGDLIIKRSDFEGSLDIIPVSDPNIFSEAQRYAQVQAVLQLETVSQPGTFDAYAIRRRALSLMHVDDIDDLLPPPPQPKELNAVAEHVALSYNQPLAAFPEQDHLAHIETHLRFLTDPNTGGNPLFAAMSVPLMEHIKQHIIMFYSESVGNALKMAGEDSGDIRTQDNAIAMAAQMAQEATGELFAHFKDPFAQALQTMQAQQEQQANDIQDPSAKAMLQASLAETKRKAAQDQAENQLKQQQTQSDNQNTITKLQTESSIKLDKQQKDSDAKMETLQQQLQELQLSAASEANKAASAEQQLALKDKEMAIQRELDDQKLIQQQIENDRKLWQFMKDQELEREKMAQQHQEEMAKLQVQVRAQDVTANTASEANKAQPEEAKKEESPQDDKIAKLLEIMSKPKKIKVKRDANGRATEFEQS